MHTSRERHTTQTEMVLAINCPSELPLSWHKTTQKTDIRRRVCADAFLAGDGGRLMERQQVRMWQGLNTDRPTAVGFHFLVTPPPPHSLSISTCVLAHPVSISPGGSDKSDGMIYFETLHRWATLEFKESSQNIYSHYYFDFRSCLRVWWKLTPPSWQLVLLF